MTVVTRENGSRRDPYPPTTVSLLTNPRSDFRSARTTRIGHPNLRKLPRRTWASDEVRGTARRPGREQVRGWQAIEGAGQDAERPQRRPDAFVSGDPRCRRVLDCC